MRGRPPPDPLCLRDFLAAGAWRGPSAAGTVRLPRKLVLRFVGRVKQLEGILLPAVQHGTVIATLLPLPPLPQGSSHAASPRCSDRRVRRSRVITHVEIAVTEGLVRRERVGIRHTNFRSCGTTQPQQKADMPGIGSTFVKGIFNIL